jgi:hypothetical protein
MTSGTDLLEKHLGEIRNLHQHLEESICVNDWLREQLQHLTLPTEVVEEALAPVVSGYIWGYSEWKALRQSFILFKALWYALPLLFLTEDSRGGPSYSCFMNLSELRE